MYLSRVELDIRKRSTLITLSSPSKVHGLVESCFEKKEPRERHLWRLDTVNGKQFLYIISVVEPNRRLLEEKVGVSGTAQSKSYDAFLSKIQNGAVMRFRLTADPKKRAIAPKGEIGKIISYVNVDDQKEWLMRQASRCGFAVNNNAFQIVEKHMDKFSKKSENDGIRYVRFERTTFEGILTVTDADVLRKTLIKGIGREKAYGCGMLTVIPCGVGGGVR
jgi:CRISPR system Cascade subunit CasE